MKKVSSGIDLGQNVRQFLREGKLIKLLNNWYVENERDFSLLMVFDLIGIIIVTYTAQCSGLMLIYTLFWHT